MRRLYFRIYMTVLGSLLVFALLAGLAAMTLRSFDEDDRRSFFAMGAEVAERLLAPERGLDAIRTELAFWNQITGFSIALLSSTGEVIADTGEIPADMTRDLRRRDGAGPPWRRGRARLYRMQLKDGRWLVAVRPPGAFNRLHQLRWLAALLGIALAVAIAAYPLVRQLTRRLERLQHGVAAFGEGDLSARVDISGQDEIAKLAETFNASAARIGELLNAHKTLLANASHELRSPLSRLRMAVETLDAEGDRTAAQTEIRRNIAELDVLVEEILLASRLQAADRDLHREDVDLAGLLAEECAPFSADLDVRASTLPLLSADGRLLRRLFRNLLENAARYGGPEPPSVTVDHDAGVLSVAVCDRGPGVPPEERERIFEPFYRLRNVPESAGSTGLGLALVRQIAERHGGTVTCLPREGGGTCFRVSLVAPNLAINIK